MFLMDDLDNSEYIQEYLTTVETVLESYIHAKKAMTKLGV